MKFDFPESDPEVMVMYGSSGFVVGSTAAFVEDMHNRIRNGLRKIVIDCSELDHITSMELGALAQVHSRIAMLGGAIKLCAIRGLVPEILKVTRLEQVFDVQPDVAAALAAFREP